MKRKALRAILMDREAIILLKKYKTDNKLKNLGDAIRKLLDYKEIEKELDDELDAWDNKDADKRDHSDNEPDEPVYPPI